MGKIIVGQKSPKRYDAGGLTVAAPNEQQPVTAEELEKRYSDEQKQRVSKIMQLPRSQIVPRLREEGFFDVADYVAQQMAKQEQEMSDETKREIRLKEILAMDETDQLPLLLAEGYEEEAKVLSEKLANLNTRNVEEATEPAGEPSGTVADEPDGEAAGTVADESEGKKGAGDVEPKPEPEKTLKKTKPARKALKTKK